MSNVMAMKNLRNKVSRNGFDLSERRSLTGKVGEILPFFTLETIPGDTINLNPEHFARTMPLNSAAYTQIKEYVHFYFVPYRLLHSGMDSFLSDNHENATRASGITSAQMINGTMPYITYHDIANYIIQCRKKKTIGQTGYQHAYTTVKLLEYLGYGDYSRFLSDDTLLNAEGLVRSNMRFSPLMLLAYQKIYQDHFRNKQWEKTAPETCNMDYAKFGAPLPIVDSLSSKYANNERVSDLFSMRYCDYNKDYFFGILPNAQYGDYATVPVLPEDQEGKQMTAWSESGGLFDEIIQSVNGFSASVIAFRKAEALQKYKEIKQSGNQDYQSYLEKIFNVGVSDDRSDQCRYLGGYDSTINVSEVVNSNLVEGDADIKGKGTSSAGSRNINFQCNEFGVIIGIYTSRPNLEYAINAPSKAVMRVNSDDFANPVFDKIGMQTVSLAEVSMPYETMTKADLADFYYPLGYATRYYDYKTSYDKVMGEFKHSLGAWVAPLTSDTIYNGLIDQSQGGTVYKHISYLSFKVNPNIMNSIFKHNVNDTTETDQLWLKFGVGCPIVRNLDYDGLPY